MSDTPSKLDRSLQLIKSSFQIIGRNRKLLLFPIISFAFTIVIVLFFAAPVVLLPTGHAWSDPEHWKAVASRFGSADSSGGPRHVVYSDTAYAYLAAIYLVSMVCATFFNVAFYSEILKALRGNAVSIRSGLSFACSRIGSILMWSLFAGVVGLVIRGLERRFGLVGRIILRLVGTVWSVACVFVVPVIVASGSANPVELLRNSASTLKKTWGESLIGYVGITFASWIIIFGSVVILGGGFAVLVLIGHPMLMVFIGAAWFVCVFALGYLLAVANHIFRCALYIYASEGTVTAPFTQDMISGAWKIKKA
jgi:hypothetical protein